jgi:EAL domain-containing protein (putative c-di-GMP-specific phosphodiesterase class I)
MVHDAKIQADSVQRLYKAGDIIIRQGDLGASAFIIEKGRVEISILKPNGQEVVVGTRGPGAMIGEMAIIDSAPRTATVKASENCELLEITKEDFSARLKKADPVLRMTMQVILTRFRDTLARANIEHDFDSIRAEAAELSYAEETNAVEKIKIANDFKDALKNNELQLYYQPIVDMHKGEIAGFEALMRWEHPERGFISPSIFIPIAEESGLIVEASQWALRESCLALKRMEQRTGYHSDLFMSVNFSSTDFAAEDFVTTVYNIISESDVAPEAVHLEITERLLMDQPDNAKDTLEMCQKAGMSIAIDDFGTGYSSLSYLHYFPIDTLKIDQSFIRDMHKDEASLILVKSIISLGKNMKMKIIAEGVETREEALELKALGCDLVQGYFFARPMPELDVTNFITEKKLQAL